MILGTGTIRLCRLCLVRFVGNRGTKPSIVRPRKKWGFRGYLSTAGRNYILMICSLQLVEIPLSPVFDEREVRIRLGGGCGHEVMIPLEYYQRTRLQTCGADPLQDAMRAAARLGNRGSPFETYIDLEIFNSLTRGQLPARMSLYDFLLRDV